MRLLTIVVSLKDVSEYWIWVDAIMVLDRFYYILPLFNVSSSQRRDCHFERRVRAAPCSVLAGWHNDELFATFFLGRDWLYASPSRWWYFYECPRELNGLASSNFGVFPLSHCPRDGPLWIHLAERCVQILRSRSKLILGLRMRCYIFSMRQCSKDAKWRWSWISLFFA